MNHSIVIDVNMLVGVLPTLGVLATFAVWVRQQLSKMDDLLDDWRGTDARPGVPRRPGVMERLEKIEADVKEIKEMK
jgi:hypothetical protein